MALTAANRPNHTCAAAGFTLAELLVALAVSAVILGFVMGGLQFAIGARQRTAGIEANAALLAVHDVLRQCIAAAVPVDQIDATGRIANAFAGDARRLDLACPLSRVGPAGEVSAVGIAFVPGQRGVDLIAEIAPLTRRTTAAPVAVDRQLLVAGLAAGEFRYLSETRKSDLPEWLANWRDSRRPPAAVALTLTLPDGDRRQWPLFIVAIRARR